MRSLEGKSRIPTKEGHEIHSGSTREACLNNILRARSRFHGLGGRRLLGQLNLERPRGRTFRERKARTFIRSSHLLWSKPFIHGKVEGHNRSIPRLRALAGGASLIFSFATFL